MKSTFKLFVVLVTVTVVVLGWITGQYRDRDYMILILVLISATLATFLVMNIYDRRQEEKRRKEKESRSQELPGVEAGKIKRSGGSFALKDKKSGLTWGGGNIKASEATRGTRRRFLGK
ncbi:MAG: hypothetical protein U9R49_08690 [Bacteroidota bacterium]|nr:hypothetical protein [Bacteroidota bacterium]